MFDILLPFSSGFDVSPDQLCQQLEREYELRIDPYAELDMDPGTMEEGKRALLSMGAAQMARMPPRERWARLMAKICQYLHTVDYRPKYRDHVLQIASDCFSSDVRDSANNNAAAATSEILPQTHQSAYISEVEREPQQRESSCSPRSRKVKWACSFRTRTREITNGYPRESSPQYSHTPLTNHASWDPTLFTSTFVVLVTLVTAYSLRNFKLSPFAS